MQEVLETYNKIIKQYNLSKCDYRELNLKSFKNLKTMINKQNYPLVIFLLNSGVNEMDISLLILMWIEHDLENAIELITNKIYGMDFLTRLFVKNKDSLYIKLIINAIFEHASITTPLQKKMLESYDQYKHNFLFRLLVSNQYGTAINVLNKINDKELLIEIFNHRSSADYKLIDFVFINNNFCIEQLKLANIILNISNEYKYELVKYFKNTNTYLLFEVLAHASDEFKLEYVNLIDKYFHEYDQELQSILQTKFSCKSNIFHMLAPRDSKLFNKLKLLFVKIFGPSGSDIVNRMLNSTNSYGHYPIFRFTTPSENLWMYFNKNKWQELFFQYQNKLSPKPN